MIRDTRIHKYNVVNMQNKGATNADLDQYVHDNKIDFKELQAAPLLSGDEVDALVSIEKNQSKAIKNTEALASHALQGASFGFGDEIMNALDATTGVAAQGIARLVGADETAANMGGGNPKRTWNEWYNKERKYEKDLRDTFREEHPVAAVGAELAGAIGPAFLKAAPVVAKTAPGVVLNAAPVAKTLSTTAKIGRGALTGAAAGAAYGVGSGSGVSDRLEGGLTGALTGGFIGGALPAVGAGLKKATKLLPNVDAKSTTLAKEMLDDAGLTEKIKRNAVLNKIDDNIIDKISSESYFDNQAAGKMISDMQRLHPGSSSMKSLLTEVGKHKDVFIPEKITQIDDILTNNKNMGEKATALFTKVKNELMAATDGGEAIDILKQLESQNAKNIIDDGIKQSIGSDPYVRAIKQAFGSDHQNITDTVNNIAKKTDVFEALKKSTANRSLANEVIKANEKYSHNYVSGNEAMNKTIGDVIMPTIAGIGTSVATGNPLGAVAGALWGFGKNVASRSAVANKKKVNEKAVEKIYEALKTNVLPKIKQSKYDINDTAKEKISNSIKRALIQQTTSD